MSSARPPAATPSRPPSFFPSLPPRALLLLGLVALAGVFLVYATYRQRYIWGVDSYGYYELGKLFSEGRLELVTPLPAAGQPALMPIGFSLNQAQKIVPNYPPGFPLLMAVGHWLGAPMFVTPFIGAVSCVLLFFLLRPRTGPEIALLLSIGWAFMPLTLFGGTMLMSDLVAATGLLATLLAFRHGRLATAAWLLGFSFAIRPTNVLFLVPFAFLLRFDRATRRFALHLAVPCALYAVYNHILYGAPWHTGYGDISQDLKFSIFPSHFWFYLSVTPVVLSPVLLGLAAVGLRPWNREKAFLVAWPLVFMVFYGHWAGAAINHPWWARFILPGYPAFFLLGGEGAVTLLRLARRIDAPRWRRAALALVLLALASLPVQYIRFGTQRHLWDREIGVPHYRVVQQVVALAPPGSMVGSVELVSSFALYSSLIPFVSTHESAPDLVARELAAHRPVFLLVEPWRVDDHVLVRLRQRFQAREVAQYDFLWKGLKLYELTPR